MNKFVKLLVISLVLFFSVSSSFAQDIDELLADMVEAKFSEKEELVEKIGNLKTEFSLKILQSLENGTLYYIKKNKKIVYAEKVDSGYSLTDILSEKKIDILKKREIKRVSLNNKLRKLVRTLIAKSSLTLSNPSLRIKAAKVIFNSKSLGLLPIVNTAILKEENVRVKKYLESTQARLLLLTNNKKDHIKSLEYFTDHTDPRVQSVINEFIQNYESLDEINRDKLIYDKAINVANKIESDLQFYKLIENLFFGLSLGSILFLAAVGLAITFGVMGVINMAHGEMIMIGAYSTYVVQLFLPNLIEYSLFIALPFAFLITGFIGIILERGVIRYLYGRPLETLLATFGISLVLQQLVRTIFSPINMPVISPKWMSGVLEVHPALALSYGRLYILLFSITVFLVLLIILRKTHFGTEIRAVMQNRSMARAMGIRTSWIDSMTFGLGSGIAGVAGVALSQITNVGPNLGQNYLIDCFMVVVFGGVGNLWGTLSGAFILGIGNKFLEPISGAVLAKIIILVFLILFIQKRPKGMFALKGRASEVNQ
ncbi:MAG: urea ABC transporter permease subunit UrtB [Gammaproteobacteria bacterium]|nr:urea ABC transporter permease subunit UrtB [Gammaproteobacteria bacterium]